MVSKQTLAILKALADDTRLKILELLLDGEKCVCELFPKVKRTQSTVSIQLAKLEKAGIIKHKREGKKVIYSISNNTACNVLTSLGCTKQDTKKTCKQHERQ